MSVKSFLILIILLPSIALAQSVKIDVIRDIVDEGSTAYARLEVFDQNKEPVVPEYVWYKVSKVGSGNTVFQERRCSTANTLCNRETCPGVETCALKGLFECNDSECDKTYFCKSASGTCVAAAIMDLSLLPAANQIESSSLQNGHTELNQIEAMVAYPDECTLGTTCTIVTGAARYEVRQISNMCVDVDSGANYHGVPTYYTSSYPAGCP